MLNILFYGVFLIQALYWIGLRTGLHRAKKHTVPSEPEFLGSISTIVAARNEAEQLPTLFQALSNQTHPDYEILIVDDHSTDTTSSLIEEQSRKNGIFKLISASSTAGKKHALSSGIASASHSLLAFTDADCSPPPNWLRRLAAYHHDYPEAVLVGYGPFYKNPTLLNRFVRYETLTTALFTCASIGLNRPYMAVGRNMSYPRTLLERLTNNIQAPHLLSGDDDLLVQAVAHQKAGQVIYLFDADTFVPSDAPASWQSWFHQKRRHTSASRAYNFKVQGHLLLYHTSNLLLWFAPLVLGWLGLGLLLARMGLQGDLLRKTAKIFKEEDVFPLFPLLEFMYVAYNTLVAPIGVLLPPKRWG